MFSEKIFLFTLLVSLAAHGAFLLSNPNLSIFPHPAKKEQEVKISYVKAKPEPEKTLRIKLPAARRDESFLNLSAKITLDKASIPAAGEKIDILKAGAQKVMPDSLFRKPALAKPDVISIRKKIQLTIPNPNLEKLNSLSYITHSQVVREKIKRALYQNYSGDQTGIVNLSFLLTNDGYIKEVKVLEEGSSPNQRLREIAARSIKDAAPFPNFPKELDYPQLSFNVIVSFEIE